MDLLLIVALVVLSIFGCFMFLQKPNAQLEEYEDKIPEPVKKALDLGNKTHVGWVYKNGSKNTDEGNYTLYYDNNTSKFLIDSILGDDWQVLDLDNVYEGMNVTLGNGQYYIHIWEEEEE